MAVAELLKKSTALRQLSLAENRGMGKGFRALAEALRPPNAKRLTELNLSGCALGRAGGKAIAKAVRANSVITSLDLHNNELGKASTEIAAALVANTVIQSCDMRGNTLTATRKEKLRKALAGCRESLNVIRD